MSFFFVYGDSIQVSSLLFELTETYDLNFYMLYDLSDSITS